MELPRKCIFAILVFCAVQVEHSKVDAQSNPNEAINIQDEIRKLENRYKDNINANIDRFVAVSGEINSRVSNLETELQQLLDTNLAPLIDLLNGTLKQFPNSEGAITLDKFVLPKVKAELFNNITTAVKAVLADNPLQKLENQVIEKVDQLNYDLTEERVLTRCEQYRGQASYNTCVRSVLVEFENVIKGINSSLNNIYNDAIGVNESINNAISINLKPSLNKLYSDIVSAALREFTQTAILGLYDVNAELGRTYNNFENKVDRLNPTTTKLLDATLNNIRAAVDFAQRSNLSINFQQVYPNLETLRKDVQNAIAGIVNAAEGPRWDKEKYLNASGPITIDLNQVENALKNCTTRSGSFEQVVDCIKPIVTDFKNNLTAELATLNNSLQNVNNFVVKIDKEVNQTVQNFTVTAYVVIKNASNAETSKVLQVLEKNILSERGNVQEVLDRIRNELNEVKQLTLASIKDVPNKIEDALSSLSQAIDVVTSVNPRANLTQQKALLEKLRNEAKANTNASVSNILKQVGGVVEDLTKQYLALNTEYKNKVAELNETTINNRCKKQSGEAAFIACVNNVVTEYNNNITTITNKINDLSGVVSNLKGSINANITSKVNDDLKPTDSAADAAAAQIYSTFTINGKQVIYNALTDIRQYNISNIRSTVATLVKLAKEVDTRAQTAKNDVNYKLNTAGTSINDIVGIGRILCGPKSVDPYIKQSADNINAGKALAAAAAPDLAVISNGMLQLATYINNTLNYQINLLSEERLYVACPRSLADNDNLQEFYKCILVPINNFGKYYNTESGLLRFYEYGAYEQSRYGWALLSDWNNNVVIPKVNEITSSAKQLAEGFYTSCNITKSKVIDYTLGVARNHNNSFFGRISSNVTAINDLVTVISNRNFRQYTPEINADLEAAVEALKTAITVVLNLKPEVITQEIRSAPGKLLEDGVKAIYNFTESFPASSLRYLRDTSNLIQTRDDLYKKYTYDFIASACSNLPSSTISDFSGCTNSLTYRNIYVSANENILNQLLNIKRNLQDMNTNYAVIFKNQANIIVREQRNSAYYLAYRIYRAAGLTAPRDVAAVVDINRCYYGVTLPTSEFICLIVV